ncbi:MAG: hypothetical protein KIS65_04035 [Nitrosomonas sp.]|nr:hypothetical protein [Nitrosomonas sp.]
MNKCMKSFISTAGFLGLLLSFSPAISATTSQIETLFNWAENTFPELFPDHQITQMVDPWAFRHYPATGIYAGVKNDEVFVLGGPWGTDNPTFIDTLPNLLTQIEGTGGNGSVPACNDTSAIPQGMVVTQSGNVVNITTNGQCIKIPDPENTNFCEPPASLQATGISILSTNNVNSFQTTGITLSLPPGVPDPLSVFAQTSSSCIINAQEELTDLIVNSNICFDMTDQYSSLSGLPGITISPPVTITTVTSSVNQRVPDCFTTNAAFITDIYTGESWVNTNGNFVPIPNSGF